MMTIRWRDDCEHCSSRRLGGSSPDSPVDLLKKASPAHGGFHSTPVNSIPGLPGPNSADTVEFLTTRNQLPRACHRATSGYKIHCLEVLEVIVSEVFVFKGFSVSFQASKIYSRLSLGRLGKCLFSASITIPTNLTAQSRHNGSSTRGYQNSRSEWNVADQQSR